MKAAVYNKQGEKASEADLDPAIFGVEPSQGLLHQVMVAQQANARGVLAHAKGRSEVSGGGRKPWRQKGTGRARHGSSRSPIWIGGGVTFGPTKERNFKQKVNKKMRRKALLMALSNRAASDRLVVVDDLSLPEIKTKRMTEILGKLPIKGRKTLVVTADTNEHASKSVRNVPDVSVARARDLNLLTVLSHDTLVVEQAGIEQISKTFAR